MKKRLLRILSALTAVVFLGVLSVIPSLALGSQGDISSIGVEVTLLPDGTAQVIELWDVELDDNWSELYVPKDYLGSMTIKNLAVKDLTDGVEYTDTGTGWNLGDGLSISEKRQLKYHKCGILEKSDGGVELCWGVSGEGSHKYQVSYLMTNVVQGYADGYDGFHIRFVNEGLSSTPEHVSVTVDTADVEELTSENTKFWAFGLQGTSKLSDGRIVVESDDSGNINFCNVMVRFEKGIFEPSVENSTTFREVVETAFEGSDYDIDAYDSGETGGDSDTSLATDEFDDSDNIIEWFSNGTSGGVGSVLRALFVPIMAFFVFGYAFWRFLSRDSSYSAGRAVRVNSTITRQEKKEVSWSRDIPFGGDLSEAYLALETMDELPNEGTLISAYLLRWLKNGWVRVEEKPEKRLMGLMSDKMAPSIVFTSPEGDNAGADPASQMTSTEQKLWKLLKRAAGDDGILQEKELKKYTQSHYEELQKFFERSLDDGKTHAVENGYTEDVVKKVLFFNTHSTELTAAGKEKYLQLLGFRKYLQDFTIINEREARDVGLWGDYLTFAALFGIADEVAEQFKKLVPDFFTNPDVYGYHDAGWNMYEAMWIMHMMNRMSDAAYNSYMAGRSAAEIQTSSSGGGGYTSFGGGGGFSGGGFGGGGR